MRVLTVGNMFPPHSRGGYERMWAAAVEAMRARGWDVTVLTTDHAEAGVEAADPPWVHRSLRWWWRDDAFPRIGWREALRVERHDARVLASFEADHVQWWAMGGMPLRLIGRTDRPALGVVHDLWPGYGPRVDPVVRALRGRWPADRVAWWSCNSAWTARRLAGVLPADRVSVDHPGIAPLDAAPPREWSGALAVVGRVEPRKGIEEAIACTRLVPGASLEVAGPGTWPSAPPGVTFTGPVSDVAAVYAAADAVLFPVTWDEPFGLVPLEAMAVGRPVVATGTGGSAEYLEDGENCLRVPPGDAEALAAAVRRLAGDPELRARLVAGGRATAERFTLERFTAAICRHAERCVP